MGTKSIPAQKAPSSTNSNSNAASNFIIGDKVILSGSKVGRIQFLGETEFAPGQWAGIVLEDAVGKNNGSVAGVQYFQCEPMHGVFARPSKLVRANNETAGNTTGVNIMLVVIVRYNEDIKVGDRVNVGDAKVGTVRFVGETEFAKGCWVGIELDSAQGKNDGSVAGNRYFTCEANFGLFALRHKVKKVAKKTAQSAVKKRPTVKSPGSSASSVSSVTSIPSLRRPSKFLSPFYPQLQSEVSSRYKQKTAATGVQALQEALVEKQQHVESLIAERDQEKSELMEVNLTAAMKQDQLNKLQEAHDQFVKEKESQLDQLRRLVEEADLEKVKLAQDLDEERRKAEDYQFQLEEGQIIKDDMEVHRIRIFYYSKPQEQVNNSPVFELEEQLLESKSSLEETEATIAQMKKQLQKHSEETFELKNQLKILAEKRNEQFTAVDAVAEKERQISSLEQDLLNANQSLESIKEEKKKTEEEVERMMLEMKSLNEDREKLEQSCKEEIKQKINLQEEVERFKESLDAKDAEFDERLKMIEEKDQLCSQLNQKLFTYLEHKETQLEAEELKSCKERSKSYVEAGDNLAGEMDDLKSEHDKLQKLLEASNAKVSEQVKHIKELEGRCSMLGEDLKSSESGKGEVMVELQNLKSQNDEIFKELNEAKLSIEKLRSENVEKQELFTYKQQTEEERKAKEKLKSELESLNESLCLANQEKEDLSMQLEKTKSLETKNSECDNLQIKVKKTESEKTEVQKSLENLKTDLKKVNSEFSEVKSKLEEENKELESKNAELVISVADLSEKSHQVSSELDEFELMTSKCIGLQDECKHLEETYRVCENEKTNVEKQCTELSGNFSNLEKKCEKVNSEKVAVTEELEGSRRSLKEMTAQLSEQTAKAKKLDSKFQELTEKYEKQNSENVVVTEELESSRRSLKEMTAELADQTAKAKKLDSKFQELTEKYEKQNSEKLVVTEELESSRRSLKEMTAELADVKLQKELLSTNAEDIDAKTMQVKAMKLQEEKEAMLIQCNDFESELQSTRSKLELTASEYDNLQVEIKKTESEKTEVKKSLENLKTDLEKELDELKSKHETLVASYDESKKNKDEVERKLDQVNQDHLAVLSEMEKLKLEKQNLEASLCEKNQLLQSSSQEQTQVEEELTQLKSQLELKCEENSTLDSRCSEFTSKLEKLETENKKEIESRVKAVEEAEINIRKLQEEKDAIVKQCNDFESELQSTRSKLELTASECDNLQVEIKKTESEKTEVENSLENLKTDLEKVNSEFSEAKLKLEEENAELVISVADLSEKSHQVSSELDELKSKHETLVASHDENGKVEIGKTKSRNQLFTIYQHHFKTEEETLQAKVKKLEITRLKSEQVLVKTLQDQVDFLNKVIIDQQQKIKMLTDKIEELEGLKSLWEISELKVIESRKLAPRLFCDICDVFDAHDTEDCPTQSMMEPDPAGASQHYERGEGRAYCEDCEVFGHWTDDC
uniref:CAP-Gly domain-containing protein n=1 Tax=Ciona intestinalis TaxID=7719 RepID=H2XNK3_CIOIN